MWDIMYAGTLEKCMAEYKRKIGTIPIPTEKKSEVKKMVDDIVTVLKQNGYDKGAEIFAQIMEN